MKYKIRLIWDFIRYDVKWGIKNFISFFKSIGNHRPWDFQHMLPIMKKSLQQLCNTLEQYGHEVDESRLPKIRQIKTAIYIINNFIDDRWYDLAQKKYGELPDWKYHWDVVKDNKDLSELIDDESPELRQQRSKVIQYSYKIEARQWILLWDIIKGIEGIKGTNALTWWD